MRASREPASPVIGSRFHGFVHNIVHLISILAALFENLIGQFFNGDSDGAAVAAGFEQPLKPFSVNGSPKGYF